MELAVIKTGGKQYLVSSGQKIKIDLLASLRPPAFELSKTSRADEALRAEKIDKKNGQEIIFDQVLLLQKGDKLEIGIPFIKGAKVIGKIIQQGKVKKLIVFKYKAKKRYKVKKGHRQSFIEVEIKDLLNK